MREIKQNKKLKASSLCPPWTRLGLCLERHSSAFTRYCNYQDCMVYGIQQGGRGGGGGGGAYIAQ